MADFPAGHRRRDWRRDCALLEFQHGRTAQLAHYTRASHLNSVHPSCKRALHLTWLPEQLDHGALVPLAQQNRGDS